MTHSVTFLFGAWKFEADFTPATRGFMHRPGGDPGDPPEPAELVLTRGWEDESDNCTPSWREMTQTELETCQEQDCDALILKCEEKLREEDRDDA